MAPSSDGSQLAVAQDDTGALTYQYEDHADDIAYTYSNGYFNGDLRKGPFVSAGMQWYQLGIWDTALDSDENGMGWNIGPIQALYNEGRGWAVDWRRNTTQNSGSPFTEHLDYRQSENLIHLCQFGAVEEPFSTKRAGRDTGNYLPDWQGELNWTYDRQEQGYDWQRVIQDANYHQYLLLNGLYYDNLPQSWMRGTDIYDVLSPLGTNGTTQYDRAYPGQGLTGNGSVEQTVPDDYPSYSDWVAAGSDILRLPWISAPYAPGYHKDDPNKPLP